MAHYLSDTGIVSPQRRFIAQWKRINGVEIVRPASLFKALQLRKLARERLARRLEETKR